VTWSAVKNSDLPVLTWSIKCGKPLCKASIAESSSYGLSGPFKNLRSKTLDCLFSHIPNPIVLSTTPKAA